MLARTLFLGEEAGKNEMQNYEMKSKKSDDRVVVLNSNFLFDLADPKINNDCLKVTETESSNLI